MEINGDTIHFKSNVIPFEKEQSGLKNNTVRRIDDNLVDTIYDWYDNNQEAKIEIKCVETGETFTRILRDITVFEEDIFIFTWND